MAVACFRGYIGGEYCGKTRMERQPSGRRRVFVQTEAGFVLGIELDSSDNARTVKRKLQLALDVPTEERSLMFGDTVLKNDLSTVRNDSPLLLIRNFMHKSSSTPCLSPTGKDFQQSDKSGPIEILGSSKHFAKLKLLVKEVVKGTRVGMEPVPVHNGLGGAYYFKNCCGETIAIVKPTDEEPYAPNNPKGFVGKALGQPGLKRSVRVGETGFREAAAYLLDYDHFAKVPPTALVKVTHSIFNVNDGMNGNRHKKRKQVSKIASLQQFIPHDFDASDHGTSSFLVSSVHRIGILDVRILNTDRHAGNLLIKKLDGIGKVGQMELVPIDHGLCLPESLEDPYFEWISWPQASIPFSGDELEYISHLDPFPDTDMLRRELPMIRESCLRVLVVCTLFLKEAAAFGLCLAEIGEMMSGEFRGHGEEPSELELICMEARNLVQNAESLSYEFKVGDREETQCDVDCEEELDMERKWEINPLCYAYKRANDQNHPSKLKKRVEDDNREEEMMGGRNELTLSTGDKVPTNLKTSNFLKNMSDGKKSGRYEGALQKCGYMAGTSSGNRCVDEQLPASNHFVQLADLTQGEWVQYLEKFRKLLSPAFCNRKSGNIGQKQRRRLGTPCQF